MKYIVVDIETRLPDIHKIPKEYETYGRIAILQNGSFWHGTEKSSHPHCQIGFYYATQGNRLFLSPRGCAYGFEDFVTKEMIKFVLGKIKMRATHYIFTHELEANNDSS